MEELLELESILVADCGSIATRVALIDLVADEFRLVATGETATTVEVPWSRISIGVREAIRQIERLTGRVLLSGQEQLILPEREDGGGVDAFVATVDAAIPLQVAVVGLIGRFSVDSLLKATEGSYVVVRNVVARDDRTSEGGGESTMVAMVRDTLRNRPDAILLGGGIEGGAVEPVLETAMDVATALAASEEGGKVHVVFAGNRDARTDIVRILGDSTNLHVVDNVRPTLADEDLGAAQEEIRSLYRETKMGRVPGFGELKSWVSAPVMATAEGLELALRYLSRAYQLDTVAVDVGGSATHVAGVIGGRLGSTVSAQLGMGYGIRSILDEVGIDRILRWLPFEMDEDQAYNQILNKALRPMTVPETVEGLLLEQAAAREAISLTLERARGRWLGSGADPVEEHVPPVDLIVGRGGVLSEAPVRGLAVLILLDAIQPTGICALALDQASLLPQLGALASLHPLAATQVLARDGILKLGTAISLTGSGKEGAVALKLKIDYDDGQTLRVEVPYGAMEVIPLMEGKRAVVELRPSSRFDVGLGKKGKGATTELDGGVLGIIVDARGRPLSLPGDGEKRRAKIREWMGELGI
jgi:uncharacterized protein (TIGR01319 family)